MSDQDALEAIIAMVPTIEVSKLVFVSSTVWFLWDWVISIDAEIELFWGKKLNTGSVLYFSNRFLSVVTLVLHFQTTERQLSSTLSAEMCKPVIFTILILTGLSASVLQTVLVLRTYALWDRSNWIFWFLMGLNVSASIAQQGLIMNIWGKNGLDIIFNPLPAPYTGCLVDFKLGTWERYVPTLVFELGVVFFLLVKFVAYIFQGRSNRVLYILFRDGFIEFTAVTLFSIFSLLLGIVGPKNSDVVDLITFDLSASISVICCARMLLNIRDVMTLSDPLDTTKPNPWSLDDSFDERYGIDRHTVIAPPETSRVEMFESFFGNSERATHMTSVPSEQAEATSPVVSNHAPSRDPVDIKGKGVSREPADMGSNEGLEDRA